MVKGKALNGSAKDISNYCSKDDYFSEGGQVAGQWHGAGAEHAGFVGDVKPGDLRQILSGIAPNGQQLVNARANETEHRPGWDFTISAPKSLSELALVARDPVALKAHEAGVAAVVDAMKRDAQIRVREGGELTFRQTSEIFIATFNHSTSREGEPQLHTHAIEANMGQAKDGAWYCLEPLEQYKQQQAYDVLYHSASAAVLVRNGFQLDVDRRTGHYEITGVPKSLCEAHSTRTEQIDRELKAKGLTRETASAKQRDDASLATRAEKVHEDPIAARDRWQQDAKDHGWDYEAHKRDAVGQAMAMSGEHRAEVSNRAADHAVAFASQHLSERESRFTRADLETAAMSRAMGDATPIEIRAAVDRAVAEGALVVREIDHGSHHPATAAFTTPHAIRDESRMLASEARGRGKLEGLMTRAEAHAVVIRAEAKAAAAGRNWNEGQRTAAIGALTSRNTVTGIQGYAGTAKTSTVLATLAQSAKERAIEVKAMAPTGTAAQKLGNEIGAESSTVTKFLNDAAKPGNENMGRGSVWIVDEASLLSTSQSRALVELAEGRGAHLVLTGDVKQHEAVEAGGPFAQLREAGMQSHVLGDILRQQNEELRGAVYSSVENKAAEAFAKLETGGGQVIQIADADARHQQMAVDYTALKPGERDNTIMVSSSRDGRDAITANVRGILLQKGELSGPAVNVQGLDRVDMTKAQARYVDNYQPGQVVQFAFNLKSAGLEAGKLYEVVGTNKETNRITLKAEDGSLREWNPKQGGTSHVSVSERVNVELRQGDKVALTGRLENGTNGMSGLVEVVNGREATARLQNREAVKMRDGESLPVRHGYVHTTYAAQGQTCGKVMANMPATGKGAKASTDRAFYVSLSRGQVEAKIYTNDQAKLAKRVSVRTAKTNALDHGAETKAAQQGRFEDHAAMRGPTIAEAKQRISAGLEKPQATLQQESSRSGMSPSQVAERMGANKALSETALSKPAATKDETERSRAEPVRAPRIEEVRERIERPIERDASRPAERDQVGRLSGQDKTTGFTKEEIGRADAAMYFDREQSNPAMVYAEAVLDNVQAEKWNAEYAAEHGAVQREVAIVAGDERHPVADRETVAEREGVERSRQETNAEQHRADTGVDRAVENARFERDAGAESSHAAAWSELGHGHGQLSDHAGRGVEKPQERNSDLQARQDAVQDRVLETGGGKQQHQGPERGEHPQQERGDNVRSNTERQSISDKGAASGRAQDAGDRYRGGSVGEGQRVPTPQVGHERQAVNADHSNTKAGQAERSAVAESRFAHDGNNVRRDEHATHDSKTDRLAPQATLNNGSERGGIAPSDVAARMTKKMVEREIAKAGSTGSQTTRGEDREMAAAVRESGKGDEREHKRDEGLER